MRQQAITETGLCDASIKSEWEIQEIREELENTPELCQTIRWLEAIKDPTRLRLIYLLYKHDQLCVCDLSNVLNVSSSAISQHLRKLKDMDLVSVQRDKQTMFYSLKNSEFVDFIANILSNKTKIDFVEVVS
jgi:DNA-binding transcriptional ArsR family regulator